jgi:hypothetical protein
MQLKSGNNTGRIIDQYSRVIKGTDPSQGELIQPAQTDGITSRRNFLRGLAAAGLIACCRGTPAFASATSPAKFVHPGLLHTEADFDRMRQKVAANASPWIDGWNVFDCK